MQKFFQFFGETHIDFVGFRWKAFIFSMIVIVAGLISMVIRGGMPLGVDFAGGTLIQVQFDQPVDIGEVRRVVTEGGFKADEIQQVESREYLVKIALVSEASFSSDKVISALQAAEPGRGWKLVSAEEVRTAQAGGEEQGGSLVVVESSDAAPAPEEVTAKLAGSGLPILEATKQSEKRVAIRVARVGAEEKLAERLQSALSSGFTGRTVEIRRTETVGPKIGRELRQRAWAAVVVSLFGILVYVAWRFEIKFAVGAIASLVHDVLFVLGCMSLLGKDMTLLILAAILTIIGYSLNDTIVVYDRIRENFGLRRKESYESMINISINETLSRTIITGLTTICVVLWLLFMGGEVLHDFALAMTIGLISGTYSSIYVAAFVVVEWNRIANRRRAAAVQQAAAH